MGRWGEEHPEKSIPCRRVVAAEAMLAFQVSSGTGFKGWEVRLGGGEVMNE